MIEPALPNDEAERLAVLKSYQILDTEAEIDFDDFTHLARHICDTPIALITLLDENRQWFKSKVGLGADSTPRSISFCGHAILQEDVFEIHNALDDPRFFDNPLVTGEPNIRFYAGVPIITPEGHRLGTLCVIDTTPKHLNSTQRDSLVRLSRQVMSRINTRFKAKKIQELNYQLVQKNHFIEKITNNIPVLISYLDQDLKIRFANNAYTDAYKLPLESIVGKALNELTCPEIYQYVYPYAIKALDGQAQQFEISAPIFNCDSYGAVHYIPDIKSDGHVIGFYSLITDITDHVRLQEKQQLATKVIQHASDAILITDANHRIISVNPGFTKLTQYSEDEVMGKIPCFFTPENSRPETYEEIIRALETQYYWSSDKAILNKSGSIVYVHISIDCIFDDHCRVINHVSVYVDRTMEVNHRNELERLTGMLNRTGEMAKIGGWEHDLIQNKFSCSPKLHKILETNPYVEIDENTAINFVAPEYQETMLKLAESCFYLGIPWNIEVPLITASGRRVWVQTTGERVVENGVATKLVGSTQDITARKELEIQRKHEEIAQKTALVREVHHRIKNHLMGVSNLLFNYSYSNPQLSEPITAAISKIHSVAVIHGLQGKDQETRVELFELISSISESMSNLWETAIIISKPNHISPLFIAESECVPIALILNELISNAIKHRKIASKIMIKFEQLASKENIQITISNLLKSESDDASDIVKGNGLCLLDSLMPKYGTSLKLKKNDDTMDVYFIINSPILELD